MIGEEFKFMSPLSDDICEQHVHDRNIKRGTTCKDHMPIRNKHILANLRFGFCQGVLFQVIDI
ncbi:hypothetical protein BLOT_012740 [Blomia tropicalis]|nr:hypothetical protein BLOT_012740 [Blomia tropicalis]